MEQQTKQPLLPARDEDAGVSVRSFPASVYFIVLNEFCER